MTSRWSPLVGAAFLVAACAGAQADRTGAPATKPDQLYDVTLVSVAVSPAADVYVNDGASSFGSLAIPRTDTRDSSTLATWNQLLGKLRADQIIDKTVTLEVKDDLAFRP